jgi:SAM-dependent methyltransferase
VSTGGAADCPLCGPHEARPWTKDRGFGVVRCRGCSLLITWPRPDAAVLDAVYAGDYYESRGMGCAATAATRERVLQFVRFAGVPVQRVLDFGAGQGHLVHGFREHGLQADGLEPSPGGRDQARSHYGLDLFGTLAEAGGRRYDLITLVHSLEHVAQPVEALAGLRPLLAPGGRVVVEVPHARSVERLRPRRRHEILDLPAHLYHFVPGTLAAVAHRAGLAVDEVALTNPDLLEWALALRARWKGRGAAPAAAPSTDAPPPAPPPLAAGGSQGTWAGQVLPWIRTRFPGWKFQARLRPAG